MSYVWEEKKVGSGGSSPIEVNPSAPIGDVDPYEDWEKETRPEVHPIDLKTGKKRSLWQPVYVELRTVGKPKPVSSAKKAKASADRIIGLATQYPAHIALPEETSVCLAALSALAPEETVDEACLRFFVFRPEREAYSTQILRDGVPYKVMQVGPAIPFAELKEAPLPIEPRGDQAVTVATAIIDDQIGFLNERFRSGPTSTRIERLWIQGMPTFTPAYPQPGPTLADIGVEYNSDRIDEYLKSYPFEDEAYREAYPLGVPIIVTGDRTVSGFDPRTAYNVADPAFIRPFGFQAGHGTHVLDLAAGYPLGTAPQDRPIFAVQLPKLAAAETSGARLGLFVLLGLVRILRWADTAFKDQCEDITPISVVVNISYGFLSGPKDGSGFLESEIARLVRLRNQRLGTGVKTVVVMPSGNGFRAQTRARVNLSKGGSETVILRHQPEDRSDSFVELWTSTKPKMKLTIAPPIGDPGVFDLRKPAVWDWKNGTTAIGRVYIQDHDNRRRRVVIALSPTINFDWPEKTAPSGAYRLTLANTGSLDLVVDIDVQRDDTPSTFPKYGRQAYLDHPRVDLDDPETFDRVMPDPDDSPVTRSGTISAMVTSQAKDFVVVGGAFDRHAFQKAALYATSSAGLPCEIDLSAVSEESRVHPGRLATGLFSGSAVVFMGTSTAAPQVTRAIVEQIAATGDHDLSGLTDAEHTYPGKDHRLGAGVMPFVQEPGRVPRRGQP